MSGSEPNSVYWDNFNGHQRAKHELIREYLNGWFPKLGLGRCAGRVLYFDTHAGKGRHTGGQVGSPIVALQSFLEHSARDMILAKSEVRFVFIEQEEENLRQLQEEVGSLELPDRVHVDVYHQNCFDVIRELTEWIRTNNKRLAPAFVFIDPFGFKLPVAALQSLMNAGRVELFINFMWREVDMSIANGKERPNGGDAENMDMLFGCRDWINLVNSNLPNERAEQAVDLLRNSVNARWATHVRMRGDNGATRYILLHLTGHDEGRVLMKDCVWKICPDGGFYVRKNDDGRQLLLIEPQPDWRPLREWLLDLISKETVPWDEIKSLALGQIWRETHVWKQLEAMRKEGIIISKPQGGRLVKGQNPRFSLPSQGSLF